MKNPNIVKAAALTLGTLVALLSFSGQALGQVPNDPFVILLKGIYQPVVHGPNLGLSQINLSDGSYSKTDIYRVSGLTAKTGNPVSNFYARIDHRRPPTGPEHTPGRALT